MTQEQVLLIAIMAVTAAASFSFAVKMSLDGLRKNAAGKPAARGQNNMRFGGSWSTFMSCR